MKYIFIISFLSILISCNTIDTPATDQSNELVQKFKPFLHGVWVPSDYIDAIVKTKSPLKSSEELAFISEFIIDTSAINADSIHVDMALGNHEGSDFILFFKQGQNKTSLLTSISGFENEADSYELGYITGSNDTSLLLYHYDKNKKLVDKTKYIKVSGVEPGHSIEDGFEYIVNQKLISGSYIVTDTIGTGRLVSLDNEGNITGFPGSKTYYIITDFVAESEKITDQICFDIQTANQKCYGFNINNDTINLFATFEDDNGIVFKLGPAIYKFIKKKNQP